MKGYDRGDRPSELKPYVRETSPRRESDGRVQRRRRSFWESRRRRAERKKNRWPVMNGRDWKRGQENWATQRRSRQWVERRIAAAWCGVVRESSTNWALWVSTAESETVWA
ncbi:hypothetical protein M0R45_000287 [Rubus argutus]|uniref:Uncharacterized protein n=1 Tax=Rubus argutus TaxID=59490 RepID=A0AAW1VQR0_RUBAR